MKRSSAILFTTVLGLAGLGGCETTERKVSDAVPRTVDEDDEDNRSVLRQREDELREKVDDDPNDAESWFKLGNLYETNYGKPGLIQAVKCYEMGQQALDAGKDERYFGQEFTGGHYLLGRGYAKLGEERRAVYHLEVVLALEEKLLGNGEAGQREIALNTNFRDAHFWLGAIYTDAGEYSLARAHFNRAQSLGRDPLDMAAARARIDAAIGPTPRALPGSYPKKTEARPDKASEFTRRRFSWDRDQASVLVQYRAPSGGYALQEVRRDIDSEGIVKVTVELVRPGAKEQVTAGAEVVKASLEIPPQMTVRLEARQRVRDGSGVSSTELLGTIPPLAK